MQYFFVLLLTVLSFYVEAATSPTATIVDYLRDTPASVTGTISLDGPLELYRGKKGIFPITMNVNRSEGIGFSFSDQHLSINTDKGISLNIAGVPFKVNSVYYHEASGKFQVRTNTPLNIGEKSLNAQIEKVLNDHYRPKVIRAFRELKKIKSQKNLQDVQKIISEVTKIFATGGTLPTIRGNVDLVFSPQGKKSLRLDQWRAEIQARDHISIGMNFVRTPTKTTINAMEFNSSKGIRISGKTNYPEIASVNFRRLRADGNGIEFNYEIGAEEVLTGFALLMNVVKAYNGHPGDLMTECDPVRLESIRRSLDGNLKREIAQMIRSYRSTLLEGGVSPQLLSALD